jgi:hypothetical protein
MKKLYLGDVVAITHEVGKLFGWVDKSWRTPLAEEAKDLYPAKKKEKISLKNFWVEVRTGLVKKEENRSMKF